VSIAARAAKSITWTFDPTVPPHHDIIREQIEDGSNSFTGRTVSVDKALGFVPVMAAIRLRAETIGSLPLHVYQRLDAGKRVNRDHRIYSMLHDQANPEMTAMVFKEVVQAHADSWGTGYAEIEFDTDGFPWWWPLRSSGMEVYRADNNTDGFDEGELVFLYTHSDGSQSKMNSRQVFRLPGLGSNGITGYSSIHMARQALALGLGAEEFAGRFYANDARPGVALKLGPEFDYDDEAKRRLAESFDARHAGLSNKHRTAVLDEGMDIATIGFPADDAQLIEQQKWSVEQVARIFNIPPHMLHHLERATFNNIEEMGLNFVTYSLRPWLVRWEQQIKMQLLRDDTAHFAEFNVDGLLRGKLEDRMKAYWQMYQMSAISPDEIRSKENMNPLPDGKGDRYYSPVNIAEVTDEEPAEFPPLQLATAQSAKAIDPDAVRKYQPLFEDVTRNLIDLERRMVMREAEKRYAKQEQDTAKSVVTALAEFASRPQPVPQITMAEGMVKVDVHPSEPPQVKFAAGAFRAPPVTVNVEKPDAPVVNLNPTIKAELPSDLRITSLPTRVKRATREANGNIIEMTETDE
jgi:HK97 family phage portal protein